MNDELTFFWDNGDKSTFPLSGPLDKIAYSLIQTAFKKQKRTTLTFNDGVVFHVDFSQVRLVQYFPQTLAGALENAGPVSPGITIKPGGQ